MRVHCLALVVASAAVAGCQPPPPHRVNAAPTPAPPVNPAPALLGQWTGHHGGGDTPTTRVIRATQEWDAFWRQVEQDRPRPLDPAREMGVAVQLGGKRTGGFSAEIVSVRAQDEKLVVEYREHTPPPDAMVPQMLTSPWAIAAVTRSDLPVVFHRLPPTVPQRQEK